jgi:hypothetical protein
VKEPDVNEADVLPVVIALTSAWIVAIPLGELPPSVALA